jgi:hypothetical protein
MKLKSVFLFTLALIMVCLFSYNPVIAGPEMRYQAIPATTESVIAGVKIKYERNGEGCATSCQFLNDPELCGDNEECRSYAKDKKAEYIDCLGTKMYPQIGDQKIQSAGNTTGPAQVCNEFRIVTSGSPGWAVTWFNGKLELTCIGYYYAPLQLCCDPSGCVRKP